MTHKYQVWKLMGWNQHYLIGIVASIRDVPSLLFVLALELQACTICANNNITGVSICDFSFKMYLYADDILVTLSNPSVSWPALLDMVESFSHLSRYKINWSKSEAMPLNQHTSQSDLAGRPFVWKSNCMKYLGVIITSSIAKIFHLNGPNLLAKIKDDLNRWTVLPITLWGRVEILKMNILPRITYVISAIPYHFPFSWFKKKLFTV